MYLKKPSREELLKTDNNVFWTYHPNYLSFTSKSNEVSEKIKTYIK